MKKKILVIALAILVVVLIAIVIIRNVGKGKIANEDAVKFKEDYEAYNGKTNENNGKEYRTINITKDNPFVYKTEDEIVSMMNNKETFVVYFGFNTCPWCRSVIEELIEVAKDLNVSKVYYVNIRPEGEDIRDTIVVNEDGTYEKTKEGTEGYNKLLELMDNVLSDYNLSDKDGNKINVEEKRIYAPNVVAVVNGKAIKLTTGISGEQTDAYMNLTDEMKKETYNNFKEVIKLINKTCDAKEVC